MTHHRSPAGGRAGRTALGLVLVGLASVLAAPASASADASQSCRASAARVTALTPLSPLATVEPIRANAPATPCSTQSAETLSPTTVGPLRADALEAYTVSRTGSAGALAGASHPSLTVGGLAVGVQAVQASAAVTCTNGTPRFTGGSRVVGLTINGATIAVPAGDRPFTVNVGLASVRLNEQTRSDGALVQRAVHVTVPGVAEATLAEARVAGSAAGCTASGGGPTGGGGGGNPTGGPRVCPQGADFNPGTGLCVIRLPGTDRIIVVGRPYQGPSGGTVVSLSAARHRYRSPCLFGKGLPYAVIGTNRADRITGTNGADRILLLRGNDQGDGGRGNDCIDGGAGRDLLSGGLGNDRLFGGSGDDRVQGGAGNDQESGGAGNDLLRGDAGRDRVSGGAGRDLLLGGADADRLSGDAGNDRVSGDQGDDVASGGTGNDQVRAGYGHDRLYGGPGNDFLGAFLLGPLARTVDGGPGRDTAWINFRELRRTHHVERVRIFGVHH